MVAVPHPPLKGAHRDARGSHPGPERVAQGVEAHLAYASGFQCAPDDPIPDRLRVELQDRRDLAPVKRSSGSGIARNLRGLAARRAPSYCGKTRIHAVLRRPNVIAGKWSGSLYVPIAVSRSASTSQPSWSSRKACTSLAREPNLGGRQPRIWHASCAAQPGSALTSAPG